MISYVLAAIVLGGASFLVWACIGGCRLLQEHAARARETAIPLASAVACTVGVLLLEATSPAVLALGDVVAGWSGAAQSTETVVLGVIAIVWLPTCGAIVAYVAARVFALREVVIAGCCLGTAYWLVVVTVSQHALAPPLPVPWPQGLAAALLATTVTAAALGVLLARRAHERDARAATPAPGPRLTSSDVAVLVAARNEEQSLPICLEALAMQLPRQNIFVGSDGSTDRTVEIAEAWGCSVLDIQPNGGKARALERVIEHFAICTRFEVVLIADADAQPNPDFLANALPLFDDPEVVAVAGHAIPRWCQHWIPRWSMFFAAYRTRLYRVLQTLLRYGQTWRHANVSYIVPGFSSLYRTSVLPYLDLAAPGLAVEDFNMTFAIHRHRLGRIAYTPRACSVSQEAYWFRDYWKQVTRWYLGFWQTVRRHGFWISAFWLSLGALIVEMIVQSIVFLAVPALVAWFVTQDGAAFGLALPVLGDVQITVLDVVIGMVVVDYALTAIVAVSDRKPILLVYGFGFIVLRWVDSFLFLVTLPRALFAMSDGRWVSPRRI